MKRMLCSVCLLAPLALQVYAASEDDGWPSPLEPYVTNSHRLSDSELQQIQNRFLPLASDQYSDDDLQQTPFDTPSRLIPNGLLDTPQFRSSSPLDLASNDNEVDSIEGSSEPHIEKKDKQFSHKKKRRRKKYKQDSLFKKRNEQFKSTLLRFYEERNDDRELKTELYELINAGADPRITINGLSVVHITLIKNVPGFRLLKQAIKKGFDPNKPISSISDKKRLINISSKFGRKIKVHLEGQTPLHLAAIRMDKKLISYLLKKRKVNSSPRNEDGKTPFNYIETLCKANKRGIKPEICPGLYKLFGQQIL